ncbi:helix-turn-helix domain-containing protein [Streptomyces sp. NPDC059506]|uniref:helix-turn-helix domain-containing protein n=1 Tax=unclassified Streptomyces TaxID=2593676 RepID=UPI000CC1F92D|nr:helix-turn-helix domain-containing protein [Streptomyces sp. SCUT-3]PLW72338.1 DNA-binding protein [Streptomyces sp. DJ]QMV22220.1 helix-turn-helix domain-containing protein [Streptomyces sp. SCUT-3]
MSERRRTVAKATAAPSPLPSRYLTPLDVAELLGVPVETVYQWRRKRTGPRGFRVGRHLRYDPMDVRAWIESLLEEAAA